MKGVVQRGGLVPQVVLLDFSSGVGNLAERLRMQGYEVVVAKDAAEGARLALLEPPTAVVADLWMPGVSGVQLCRLLKAEPATANVPVVLRGPESPRDRFWAERAGATAYVPSGRMGDLVRALAAIPGRRSAATILAAAHRTGDIRERIAAHLDAALFESVLAAEVRALNSSGGFARLFDQLTQFTSRVMSYRWIALCTDTPSRLALHAAPERRAAAEHEAREALEVPDDATVVVVEDADARAELDGDPIIVHGVRLGDMSVGLLAVAPQRNDPFDSALAAAVIARELAGPLRMVTLVEEAERLATTDALTGLTNRRAFADAAERGLARVRRGATMAILLFDVDHFKSINDRHGHAVGDLVLATLGRHIGEQSRVDDTAGRWGGEEFIVALACVDEASALEVAERLRAGIAGLRIEDGAGTHVPVTVSIGVAIVDAGDTLASVVDRADRAMYAAKRGGRDRVVLAEPRARDPQQAPEHEAPTPRRAHG